MSSTASSFRLGLTAAAAAAAFAGCGGSPSEETAPGASTAPVAEPAGATAGKRIFLEAGCGDCHTLSAAGTKATVGPNLDEHLAGHGDGVDHIIQQVTEGGGGMPAFEGKLTKKEIRDVADFVFSATRG